MAQLPTISLTRKTRLTSVLGLTLDGAKLEGVVLRRTNGSAQVAQSFSLNLSLNPLTAGPDLVGREIRNCLESAGVRDKSCVVGLPINWVLTALIDFPDISDEDAANLLALEAERAFPCDPGSLQVVHVDAPSSGGNRSALLVGVPRANVELLAQALRAAKLHPLSFSLALPAMQPRPQAGSPGTIALSIGENSVAIQVSCSEGSISLRTLEGIFEEEGAQKRINTAAIAREIRITLGQLPPAQRESIRQMRIFGPEGLSRHLADELELRSEVIGLEAEVAKRTDAEHGLKLPPNTPMSGAVSLAAQRLAGATTPFEFLPRHTSAWQRVSRRYASGRLRVAFAAGATALVLLLSSFGYQQWRLASLDRQWRSISSRVSELERLQEQIRQYRAWHDNDPTTLMILHQLTGAFPGEGTVNAKSVEIRNSEAVTCSGTARDNRSLLSTLDKLRASPGVTDIKVSQLRGRSPTQYTFDFRWQKGGGL